MTNRENATREQLIQEISELRQRLADLERLESQRERSEEAFCENEDHYRDLVENSQDLICTHDLEGKILSANQAVTKLLGYDSNVFLGLNIRHTLAPEFRNEFDAYISAIRKNGFAKGLMLVQTRAGEKRIWEYHNTLRTEGVPAPIVRGMAHDVTDLKRTEKALQRSEEAARKLAKESYIIAEIGKIIGSTLNIEEVYAGFTEEIRKLIPFDRTAFTIINPEGGTATTVYSSGLEIPSRLPGQVFNLGDSATEKAIQAKSGLIIPIENETEVAAQGSGLLPVFRAGIRSVMMIPLISRNKVIGVLNLQSIKPKAYAEEELRIAERVGSQIAGAIANAQLFGEHKRIEGEREKLIGELQAAFSEVKRLSGLLPICASCKRIRDDKGYWNQIEAYIRDHSEASFSHGICPECAKKLYPEFIKK